MKNRKCGRSGALLPFLFEKFTNLKLQPALFYATLKMRGYDGIYIDSIQEKDAVDGVKRR